MRLLLSLLLLSCALSCADAARLSAAVSAGERAEAELGARTLADIEAWRTKTLADTAQRAQAEAMAEATAAAAGSATSVCVSAGDTHMASFDGSRFDIYNDKKPFKLVETIWPKLNPNAAGFDLKKAVNNMFTIHVKQELGVWSTRTVDNDFAIRCGADVIHVEHDRSTYDVTIKINGEDVTNRVGASGLRLPSAPATKNVQGGDSYAIYQSRTPERHSQWYVRVNVDCNRHVVPSADPGSNEYVSGFYAAMVYRIHRNKAAAYANINVEAKSFWQGKLDGACGYLPRLAGNRMDDPRASKHGQWLIEKPGSLFSMNPEMHALMAKAGLTKILDPDRLGSKRDECVKKMQEATGVLLRELPHRFSMLNKALEAVDRTVDNEVEDFIHGCAVDSYFGLEVQTDEMEVQVCGWVEILEEDIRDNIRHIRNQIRECKKEPATIQPLWDELYAFQGFCLDGQPRPKRKVLTPNTFPPCRSGGPLDEMKELTLNLINEIQTEQAAHDKHLRRAETTYADTKKDLNGKQQQNARDTARETSNRNAATSKAAAATSELASLRAKKEAKQNDIMATEKEIADGLRQRSEENAQFNQEKAETVELIQLMHDVAEKLATIKKGAFVEEGAKLRAHHSAVLKHGDKAAKVAALVEETARALAAPTKTKSALDKLVATLIKECREYIKELESAETKAKQDWRRRKENLEEQLELYRSQLTGLINNIGKEEENKARETMNRNNAVAALSQLAEDRKTYASEHTSNQKMVERERKRHQTETATRNSDIKTAREVLGMVTGHKAKMDKEGQDHLHKRIKNVGK